MTERLEKTHQLIDRALANGLGRLLDGAKITEAANRLALVMLHNRFLFKHSDEEIQEMWAKLRGDEEILHVVVNAATAFSIIYEMEMGEGAYRKLVDLVGYRTAECSFTTLVNDKLVTLVDPDYSAKLQIEPEEMANLLAINSWLFFLLLLENTCYPMTQRMVNIMAAVQGEPAKPAGKETK